MKTMIFSKLNPELQKNQYLREVVKKKYIFLHHTAGGSASSTVEWWNSKPDRIATPYLIERDGRVIETYDPKYWAFALGVKGFTPVEKASIHIELCSYGGLVEFDGKFYTSSSHKREISPDKVFTFEKDWRGFKHFEKYTPLQIASLIQLIEYLGEKFKIPLNTMPEKFWEFQTNSPIKLKPGVWSHTSVRPDKSDIFPQPELIEALKYFKA